MSYYERHLPHWQPENAALFLTWRLFGSLPKSGGGFAALEQSLDEATAGPRWLADQRVAHCVVDALLYGERQLGLYRLSSWVVMMNHVHVLLYPEAKLRRISKAIKNYSARQANKILGRTGKPFWQDESYDHWVRGGDEFAKISHYVEQNPVAAGLVQRAEEWPWSSAYGRAE